MIGYLQGFGVFSADRRQLNDLIPKISLIVQSMDKSW